MTSTSTSLRLDYADFYELSDPFATKALRLTSERMSHWLTAEQATALARGKPVELKAPLRLKGYMGRQATDFLWTGFDALVCISLRSISAFAERKLTGWATFPVEVYDRSGERLPQYEGLAVLGRGGKQDRSKSPVIDKPPRVPGGKPYQVYRGLYFDEKHWDGSDIFLVGGFTVVSQAARNAIVAAKLSNVRLTRITEVEIDVFLDRYDQ